MSATEELYRSYLDLRWHFDPVSATIAGLSTQDHRLGAYDAQSMGTHLAAFRAMAGAVESLEIEDTEEEIDRTAFLDEIRVTLLRFEHERPQIRNPGFWLGHLLEGLYGLLRRPGPPDRARVQALIGRLEAAPAFLAAARETLKDPPSVFLESAILMNRGGRVLVAETAALISAADPDLAQAGAVAVEAASAALERFEEALRTEFRPHPDGQSFAVGEDQFNRRLHFEHALRAGAPELHRYGLHLLDEVEASVVALAARIDPRRSWRDLVQGLREGSPAPPDLVGAYADAVARAREFVRSRGLAPFPPVDLDVVATPAFLRALVPTAAYERPGPYEPVRNGTFLVTPQQRPAANGLSSHELAVTAVHEAFPGHHLQLASASGLPAEVRRFTWTPLTVEGWALYCEEMMAEEGFFSTPEERLFQQVHLLWRAARIVVDVGLHTLGMTPLEAVDLLVDRVAMDRPRAQAEVRRYCAMPTYQLCYAVGRREILRLRDDYRAREGSAFSLHDFHREFLSYGGLPVSLIRWGMGLGVEE
jgi:hypothetical protein